MLILQSVFLLFSNPQLALYPALQLPRRRSFVILKYKHLFYQLCYKALFWILCIACNNGKFALTLKGMFPKNHQITYTSQHPNIRWRAYNFPCWVYHLRRTIMQRRIGIDVLHKDISFLFIKLIEMYRCIDCAPKITNFISIVD